MPLFFLLRTRCRSIFTLSSLFLCLFYTQAALASKAPTILPMGDSITVGVDYLTGTSGGYRDPLYRDLKAAGLAFSFVGPNNGLASGALTAAGQQQHGGFGGWHVTDLDANLDGVAVPIGGGDSNNGGYILTGGHGTGRAAITPDLILLHIGTNDLLQNTANLNQALYNLVTHIHALSPNTLILVAGVIPINNAGLIARVNAYNAYIKTQLVPSLFYTAFVDQNSGFLNSNGSVNANLLGADNVHPNRFGYPVLAQTWVAAIESARGFTPTGRQLTVAGGIGAGTYAPGTVITVQANAPAGNQQFANWTAASTALNNPYASPALFTMPSADATLTANYAVQGSPIIQNGNYEIASSFNGLAVATAGSAVQQQIFSNSATQVWTLTNLGGNVVSLLLAGTNEALEVPANAASTVGAALDVVPYTGATTQQWLLTPATGVLELINQSSGQALNVAGYSTSAGTPLMQFTLSYVDEWWVFYPSSVPSTMYPVTVNQGSPGGVYAAGSVIPVIADAPATGMQFAGWTGATSGLANRLEASTTLTVPAAADVITATYSAVVTSYTLAVNGGSGSGSYAQGSNVQITANGAPSGSQFAGWTGMTSTVANAALATTTAWIPASNISVTATYAALPATSSASSTVSVQFVGGGASPLHGNGYDYMAGPGSFAAGYWNPVLNTGNTTAPLNVSVSGTLLDSTGAASGFGFQLRSSGAYYTGAGKSFSGTPIYPNYPGRASGQGDGFLYAGLAYAGYSDTNPLTLTLTGLNPAHTYSILAYVTPFLEFGGQQKFTLALAGAGSMQGITDGGAGQYERVTTTNVKGNYVEFDQVTGASAQTLTLTDSGALMGLSGFQVVDIGSGSGTAPAAPVPPAPVPSAPPAPPAPPAPTPPTPVSVGTSLGRFTMLNNGVALGNAVNLPYDKSIEGSSVTTYWQGGPPLINVLAVGNNRYELVETVGNRCLTVNDIAVTLSACSSSAGQLMTLASLGSGYSVQAGIECVQAPASFSNLQAARCSGAAVQSWSFVGRTPLTLPSAPAPLLSVPTLLSSMLTPLSSTPTLLPATTAGTTLGSWSLLNAGMAQGNSLELEYGTSVEGGGLTTYWAGAKSGFYLVSMGSNQYELQENTGLRCVAVDGSTALISACKGTNDQLMTLTAQNDGSYTVEAAGQCLQAVGPFTTVTASPCGFAATQRWIFSGAVPLPLPATSPAPVVVNSASATVPAGYRLTFDDEFAALNISDLNGAGTKWYTHTVQCCLYDTSNPTTPTYMAGITAPPGQNPYTLVAGGLNIRLQKTNGAWYSGVLASVDSKGQGFAQQYGYFEMKAKFPNGMGTWPAFWLLNQRALTQHAPAGEIDVVESYMQFPTYINTTLHDWTPPATTPGYKQASVANLTSGFHTFGMLWTASTMTFYCDGVTLYSMPTPAIMHQPFYPILDLGLGGGWPTAQTPQQSDMIVQYVRVYAL